MHLQAAEENIQIFPDSPSSCNVNNQSQNINKSPEITTNQTNWKVKQSSRCFKTSRGGRFTRPLDGKGQQRLTWPPGGRHQLPFFLFSSGLCLPPQPTNNLFPEVFPPNKKLPSTQKENPPKKRNSTRNGVRDARFKDGRRKFLRKTKLEPNESIGDQSRFFRLQKRINKSPQQRTFFKNNNKNKINPLR